MTNIMKTHKRTWMMVKNVSMQLSARRTAHLSRSRALLSTFDPQPSLTRRFSTRRGHRRLHDGGKVTGLEAGTTHQGSIHVRLAHQLRGVVRLHRATVLDANLFGDLAAEQAGELLADVSVDLLRLVAGSVAPGTDRPHRLVRNNETRRLSAVETRQRSRQLARHHFQRLPTFALGKRLADADDRQKLRGHRRLHPAIHRLVRLSKMLPPL